MSEVNFVNGSGGNISPSRFVVIDATAFKAVNSAADNTHFIIGISQEWAKLAPISNATTYAADTAGDPIKVYQIGDTCLLQSSSAGWTAGDRLTSTTAGVGVTASSTDYYGAVALSTVSGAGLGQVQVLLGYHV